MISLLPLFNATDGLKGLVLLVCFVAQYFLASYLLKRRAPLEPVKLNFAQKLYREKLQNELSMAKRVQQGLLDPKPPNISGVLIAKKCVPADSVGGDFFTFIQSRLNLPKIIENQIGIIKVSEDSSDILGIAIGDVAGHGISSALIMALSAGIIEGVAQRQQSSDKVLELANKDLCRFIQDTEVSHISALYSVIDCKNKVLKVSRAGHTPLIIMNKHSSQINLYSPEGVVLGVFETAVYEEERIVLQDGDRVVFYTDGITESRNPEGEFFGMEAFKKLLIDTKDKPAGLALEHVFEHLTLYRNGSLQRDDCSLVFVDIG